MLEPSIYPCCPWLYKYNGLTVTSAGNSTSWARISDSSTSTSCSRVISRAILLSITYPQSGRHSLPCTQIMREAASTFASWKISTLVFDLQRENKESTLSLNKERKWFLPWTPHMSSCVAMLNSQKRTQGGDIQESHLTGKEIKHQQC